MKIVTLTLNPALDRSMMFDSFGVGQLNRAKSAVMTVGGKGINVSRVLCLHGVDNTAYGFCGGDTGEMMKSMLTKEGVKYDFVTTNAPTRINVKITSSDGTATEASESGGPITQDEAQKLLCKLENLFLSDDRPEYLVMSGSIPPGIGADTYKIIAQKAKEKGIKVILDCDREALRQGVTAKPYIIKPNEYELEQYAGYKFKSRKQMIDYALKLSEEFDTKIVLTLGGEGAIYIASDGVYRVNAPKVTLRGFTGAGDSFLAAFICDYSEKGDPANALRKAAAFAAAKVEKEGTLLPDKDEKYKYLDQVKVQKLS